MNHNLTTKVLCVGFRTSCLGTAAQDDTVTSDILQRYGAERGKLRATKTILADAIKPFRKLRNEARKYFNSVTLPGISDDLRITTPARLPELQKRMKEYAEKDAALLSILEANYDFEMQKDKLSLGAAFDPQLYPDVHDLHNFFRLTLSVCDMPNGDYARIEGLTEAAKQDMAQQHQKMLTEVGMNARNEVYGQLTKLIQAVADKLSNPNAQKFHESLFDNLKEYLAIVPDMNVTNDAALELLRKEASEKLNYSMRVIKDSAILKAQAADAARELLHTFGQSGTKRKLVA